MRPEFWNIFKTAFQTTNSASCASYLGQKILVCDRCITSEPEATADIGQCPVSNTFKLPKNLEKLDPCVALDPLCTLTSQQAAALADGDNVQLFILPDGNAHIVLGSTAGSETSRSLASVANLGTGFPAEAARRWYVPDYIDMCIQGAEYSICARHGRPEIITILITSGGQSIYLPLLGQTRQEDIELETEGQTYILTAWNVQERRYKKMVAKSISLDDIVNARPGAAKAKAAVVPEAPVVTTAVAPTEMSAAPEPTAVQETAEPTTAAVAEAASNVEEVESGTIEETPVAAATVEDAKPAKKTRTRKQAVPGLKLDWASILQYLQQPVADDMSIEDASAEMRIIRDVQIAAARRETNVALHVVARAEELSGYVADLAAVRDALSKLKI